MINIEVKEIKEYFWGNIVTGYLSEETLGTIIVAQVEYFVILLGLVALLSALLGYDLAR